MSAAYQAADEMLAVAEGEADTAVAAALAGIGRAILALVDEVEPIVELLRDRLPAPLPPVDVDGRRIEVPPDPRYPARPL